MIRRVSALTIWVVLLLSPVLAVYRLTMSDISSRDWNVLVEHGIFTATFIQFASLVFILIAWLVTMITVIQGMRLRHAAWLDADKHSFLSMCGVALAGFLTLGTQATTDDVRSRQVGIDVRTVVGPVMAGLAAAYVMRKSTVTKINSSGVVVSVDQVRATPEWEVVVRVFGHPRVEDCNGNIADFRKRRSLELLTWLSINRDRPRRSAARTAMWESDISDSSFATVVSDMRRALSDLCPHVPARDWAPPTFTDEIVLSGKVITDVELLSLAWDRFQSEPSMCAAVVGELSKIGDVPFAGTGYGWPDADGTTTRFVILGTHIAREIAYWAYENKDWQSLTTAVTAGLRLMPGDEELLDLQRLVLQSPSRG